MATATAALSDPLVLLRASITSQKPPVLTTTPEPAGTSDITDSLSTATHLQFNHDDDHHAFELSTPTRFISSEKSVDLRSIYLAWQNKDIGVSEYVQAVQQLNEELPSGAGGSVVALKFVEKLSLTTWLEGAADESDYLKPLASEDAAKQAGAAADVAAGAAGGVAVAPSGSRGARVIDERLVEILRQERKMGDRNTVLRGIKPTDFSHIRKNAAQFLSHSRQRQNGPTPALSAPNPALVSNLKKPTRRVEPIILLSPSPSSLLSMSNVKSFLQEGIYVPSDSSSASSTSANILHISRTLPSIDPNRPLRFIIVDSVDQFKPDYWNRVVAVFTTGQEWQFRKYKWTSPPELFSHALGIYVGWKGEKINDNVKNWGRGVVKTEVDKYVVTAGLQGRWRDREVVESIWGSIEESMRMKGWNRDGVPGGR